MVTIIISDLHLTDKFDSRKYDYLKRIISGADKVIINGDFWDGYFTDFNCFCQSKWKKLFPLLIAKKSIYLYGNHDKQQWCNDKTMLYSLKQLDSYIFKAGKETLHIEHGNRIAPAADERFPWLIYSKLLLLVYLLVREQIPLWIYGKALLNYYRSQNEKMKIWCYKNLTDKQILVCGHSHLAEYSLKERYINTGFIRHGFGQYLKITKEKIELIDERY